MPRKKKNIPDDEPKAQMVKHCNVLSCAAAHAAPPREIGKPGEGEEIAIVTVESGGEIEPLMFPLRDALRLALYLLCVLSHFGDETAATVLNSHYREYLNDDVGG